MCTRDDVDPAVYDGSLGVATMHEHGPSGLLSTVEGALRGAFSDAYNRLVGISALEAATSPADDGFCDVYTQRRLSPRPLQPSTHEDRPKASLEVSVNLAAACEHTPQPAAAVAGLPASHLECAWLSQAAYLAATPQRIAAELPYLQGWQLLAARSCERSGYGGVAMVHHQRRLFSVAHRGTHNLQAMCAPA